MTHFSLMTHFRRPVRIFILLFVISLFLMATACKSMGVFTVELNYIDRVLGGDKVVHSLASFVITFVAMQSVSLHWLKPHYLFNRLILVITFAFIIEESSQLFLPSRQFSLSDIAANMFGIVFASFTVHCVSSFKLNISKQ